MAPRDDLKAWILSKCAARYEIGERGKAHGINATIVPWGAASPTRVQCRRQMQPQYRLRYPRRGPQHRGGSRVELRRGFTSTTIICR